jgi:F0F1-type ATP synthase assembly protein I
MLHSTKTDIANDMGENNMNKSNNNDTSSDAGMENMGKWLAVSSELPCAVIALLLVGQIVGNSIAGPSGATWGALLGALFGFMFGVYSVFVTIRYFDRLEMTTKSTTTYMPPMDEILEDVTFDLDSTTSDDSDGE